MFIKRKDGTPLVNVMFDIDKIDNLISERSLSLESQSLSDTSSETPECPERVNKNKFVKKKSKALKLGNLTSKVQSRIFTPEKFFSK